MKNLTLVPCITVLIFAVLALTLPSAATAYDPKKDLVSAIDIKPTGLMMKKALSENNAAKESGSAQEFSVPVSDGLSTYIDCSAPSRKDPAKETTKDFRAVFGFHFILQ